MKMSQKYNDHDKAILNCSFDLTIGYGELAY